MDFFIQNINSIFNTNFSLLHVIMPIGISFFTFQTISYIIDVYKKKAKAQTNILDFATYICLFPQLVAGPIVRYVTIQDELHLRTHSFKLFSQGVSRFVIGLAKKVLIANTIGQLCTTLTNLEQSSVLSYWIQAIAYTLQIYFDFSGYSDMAIGLGLMFGFKFLENFNYPLIAKSITDFWRRWHISLSSFLRDYVYIPLGGNRVSKLRWIINIFIVWFLTGFWHGASFNFIIWGLYFAILLLIEKKFLTKILEKHKIFSHIYSIFFIVISFTIFSCTNLNTVFHTIKSMFGFSNLALFDSQTIYYLKSYAILLIIAIISATPLAKNILSKIKYSNILAFAEPIYYVILLIIVTSFLIDSSFNPFLYFRF